MVLRKLSQSLKLFLAVLVTVFSSGLMPSAVAYADQPDNIKVFVCKYVGTPGVNETLQTGQNPISVSSSSTGGTAVGSYFNDQQGRSFVLAVDNTAPGPEGDPDVSACPIPQNYVTPLAPTFNDLCGFDNDTYTIPNVANVIYKVGNIVKNPGTYPIAAPITITAAAVPGFTLAHGATSSWSYSFTNIECVTSVTPQEPTQDPVCGPNNDTITVQSHPGIIFSSFGWINNSITVMATAKPGYVLQGQTSWTFTDQNDACPISIPATPQVNDPCGVRNATWIVPADTNQIDWSLTDDGHLVATAMPGYVFDNEAASHDFGVAVDSGRLCPVLEFDYDTDCTDEDGADGVFSVKIDNEDGTTAANNLTVVLYDNEGYVVATETVSVPAGEEIEVEFKNLPLGEYTIAVYDGETKLSTKDLEVDECGGTLPGDECPNIAGLQLVVPAGLVKDDNGNCVTDQCPLISGVQTNTTLCPPGQGGSTPTTPTTPGQTLGTSTTTTPQVLSTSTELPAALPATGGSSNPLMIVLASVIAYGAAYFLQGRRQLAREQA